MDVPVPRIIVAGIEVVRAIPQERVPNRTLEQIWDVAVPRIMEAAVEVVRTTPQERLQHRIPELVVDVPLPHIKQGAVSTGKVFNGDVPVPQITEDIVEMTQEDSIALGLSRVMGPAGSGRSAAPPDAGSPSAPAATAAPAVVPSPSHEVAASLLRSATLTSGSSRARTRSCSPAPLPKRAPRRSSSTASGLRGSVALVESGLVTGLATKCCPPVPPPQLRLSRVSRALHAASEAPRATESASNSDDDWDALLDAHGLAPSLGGASAAVAQPADAAGACRRARDKRRRRQRQAAKRSMWREI